MSTTPSDGPGTILLRRPDYEQRIIERRFVDLVRTGAKWSACEVVPGGGAGVVLFEGAADTAAEAAEMARAALH